MTEATAADTSLPPATERPLAEALAEWSAGFSLARDPQREALLERASLHILDGIGVALASWTMEDEIAERLRLYVDGYGSRPTAHLIGCGDRAAAPLAALFNGALIHACEFDDTGHERIVHTEAFAVPTALAVAEQQGASGLDLAEAWCVGTEVALRLASVLDDRHGLWRSGFHTSAVFGCFGAAAAASKLLGLDANATANALSLATSYASGTTAGWGRGSSRNKALQPGWGAFAGIHCALLAAGGYDCAHETIDAPNGVFATHAWQGEWTPERAVEGLGGSWSLFQLTFKLHAAGAMLQATLDALLAAVVENDVQPDEVEQINIVVPAAFAPMVERWHDASYRLESPNILGFSWPCSVACMVLYRRVGPEHQHSNVVNDPRLLALADRVEYSADPDASAPPEDQLARVTVHTARGVYRSDQGRHSGYFGDSTPDRVTAKFDTNAELVMSGDRATALRQAVMDLESVSAADIAELVAVAR